MNRNRKETTLSVFISFAGIILINLAVFYPSFFHSSRADQNIYLIETSHINQLGELIHYSYSYPRHRILEQGDQLLFRPIVHAFIAFEKWLFGLHFIGWQMTGFLLHLLLLWQLLKILRLACPLFYAALFVLNFSVTYISSEMVIWQHVNGYIIFLIFFLEAFYHFVLYVSNPEKNSNHLRSMVIYLTLSCFTYELGVIGSLLMMILLHRRKLRPWAAIIPIVIYFVINVFDFTLYDNTIHLTSLTSWNLNVPQLTSNLCLTLTNTFFSGFLPYFIEILPKDRLHQLPTNWKSLYSSDAMSNTGVGINAILLFLTLLVLGLFISKILAQNTKNTTAIAPLKSHHSFLIGRISFCLILSCILIVAGRGIIHGPDYSATSLYNYYISGTFLTIFLSYCFATYIDKFHKNTQKTLKIAILIILCLSTQLNATKTYQMNVFLKNKFSGWNLFMQRTEQFIRSHKNDPGFSYSFIWSQQIRQIQFTIGKPNSGRRIFGNLADFLFQQYTTSKNPKYYLLYFDKEGILAFRNSKDAKKYLDSKSLNEKVCDVIY